MKFFIENNEEFPYLKPGDILTLLAPDGKWYRVHVGRKPSKRQHSPSPTSRTCQNFKIASEKITSILSDETKRAEWNTKFQDSDGIYRRKTYSTLRGFLFAHIYNDDL